MKKAVSQLVKTAFFAFFIDLMGKGFSFKPFLTYIIWVGYTFSFSWHRNCQKRLQYV